MGIISYQYICILIYSTMVMADSVQIIQHSVRVFVSPPLSLCECLSHCVYACLFVCIALSLCAVYLCANARAGSQIHRAESVQLCATLHHCNLPSRRIHHWACDLRNVQQLFIMNETELTHISYTCACMVDHLQTYALRANTFCFIQTWSTTSAIVHDT